MVERKRKESVPTGNIEVKSRKPTSGPLRDKSRTMARLVTAVGKVIQKSGYPGLTASNIASAAALDRKLIWTYFGGVENLVEEFIRQKDFSKQAANSTIAELLKDPKNIGAEEITGLLQHQFDVVLKDKALQKIIHWELGEKNKVLRDLADKREEIGEALFEVILPSFEKSEVHNFTILWFL